MGFTVTNDGFWRSSIDSREDYILDFAKMHDKWIQSVGSQAQHDAWTRGVVVEHLFSLFPTGWNATRQARCIGVNVAQIGRYARGQLPDPVTVFRWLRNFGAEYPVLPNSRIYNAIGVSATINRIRIELEAADIPVARRRRRALDETGAEDAAILYCLTHPKILLEPWLVIINQFGRDLREGVGTVDLETFLVNLLDQCAQLFDYANTDPFFAQAANQIANIDLNLQHHTEQLLERITTLWNSSQVTAHCIIKITEPEE